MSERKLMIPGPVDIPEDVRDAMSVASMPHYGDEWIVLFDDVIGMVKTMFGTQNDLFIIAGPGTLGLEICLSSVTDPGDTVLVANNGFFGDRMVTIAQLRDLNVIDLKFEWGKAVDPEELDAFLDDHPEVKVVHVVHHETSTGILNPLADIAKVVRKHDMLFMVDAVSSLGGVPIEVDANEIDLCVSVANKALEVPPALAMLTVSERAWKAVDARKTSAGWYTDLRTWKWYADNWGDWHPTPVTMPTSNIYALQHSLRGILENDLDQRYGYFAEAAKVIREGLQKLGFSVYAETAYASPLTSAIAMPAGIDADDLKAWLADKAGILISGGIGELKGKIIRIGHIGLSRKRAYVEAFLLAVEEYLRSKGVDVIPGTALVSLDKLEV